MYLLYSLDIRQIKPNGKLEIQLDGGALMSSLESVHNGDVDLGSVERTVAGVQRPGFAEGVKTLGQRLLRGVPHSNLAHEFLRSRRETEVKGEAEYRIDLVEEVKGAEHLVLDLLGRAEDVGVVLLEAADPGQTSQSAGQLVSM